MLFSNRHEVKKQALLNVIFVTAAGRITECKLETLEYFWFIDINTLPAGTFCIMQRRLFVCCTISSACFLQCANAHCKVLIWEEQRENYVSSKQWKMQDSGCRDWHVRRTSHDLTGGRHVAWAPHRKRLHAAKKCKSFHLRLCQIHYGTIR